MSDDLRTRIAAALTQATLKPGAGIWDDAETLADAVIRELGLLHESDNRHGDGTRLRHRYVTDWKADDE